RRSLSYLSIYLSVCLSICLSVYLYTYLCSLCSLTRNNVTFLKYTLLKSLNLKLPKVWEPGLCFEWMCSVLQVISNALGVWGLEIVLFNSREYQDLPFVLHEKAFICLRIMRVEQQQRPKLIGEDEAQRLQQVSDPGHTADEVLLDEDEEELRKALALSRQGMEVEDEEADLRRAIQLSMQGEEHTSGLMMAGQNRLFRKHNYILPY
uniref:Ataxin-3 n=1 Tax=Cyprinus carpio TaxID=7962 RepID=A0A8C1P903_CYPCA